MHPKLTNIFISDIAELRQLIISSMETIFSSFQILDLEAPLPGKPILLLNQDNCLVIISFDLHDIGNALLNGLRASEKLLCEAQLFEKLYPALRKKNLNLRERIKLLLLTPADKTNELSLDLFNEKISAYTFRGIGVNGEPMLMIEPEIPLFSHSSSNKRKSDPEPYREPSIAPSFDISSKSSTDELSTDEVLFFQRL
ncbi:MAG: hypothetical protein KAR30_02640 [Gammaproteobacteria bacterium]|nr:hypothetical protein [Gammaproteobacteria bacterium]